MTLLDVAKLRGGRALWLGAMAVALALVVAVTLARRPLDWRWLVPAQSVGDNAPAGQLEGRVWKVDPDAGTIHVSARIFGLGATPLVVTSETLVVVGAKEGGLGDLREGLRVRVRWEKRQDARLARTVEVVGGAGDAAPARGPAAPAPVNVAPSSQERAPAEPPRAETPPKAPPRTGSPTPAPPASVRAPAPAPRPAPAQAQRAATPGTPGETAAPSREPDVTDPSAVIDWLLKEAGRSQ